MASLSHTGYAATTTSAMNESDIAFALGQKQILDFRYFCADQTDSRQCRTPVTQLTSPLAKLVRENKIGGVILFAENIQSLNQVQTLISDLQKVAKGAGLPPLFIAVDQEGGRVARLPTDESNTFAGNMAIGATFEAHGVEYSNRVNTVIAKQLRATGFNVNFAPNVDVNINPDNPVINVRSYGESPKEVAQLGIAAVQALQSNGILSAMKHFPGHGDTNVDSHTGLPRVDHERAEIDAVDLKPFARAIKEGGNASPAMIMTAHIQYPQLDKTTFIGKDGSAHILPATLSKRILSDLLREEMGFNGLIVTDAMDMAGIAHYMEPQQAILQTFYAGADIALMPYVIRTENDVLDYSHMMQRLVKIIASQNNDSFSGSDAHIPSLSQIDDSLKRILETKSTFLSSVADRPFKRDNELEVALAKDALTSVVGDKTIALNKDEKVGLAMPDAARCLAMQNALRAKQFSFVSCLNLAKVNESTVLEAFVNGIDSLVIGDISPQHSAIEMGGLDTFTAKQKRATKQQQLEQIRILLTTATKASKQRIFVAMRAPYVIAEFSPLLDHAIAAYDYRVFSKADEPLKPSGVVFDVIAQWLNGEFIAKGKLPVSVFLPKQN